MCYDTILKLQDVRSMTSVANELNISVSTVIDILI
ncbi:MAG: hypothetical protein IJZ29_00010 [Clostridia bacterium]|nr:hypothetical protein [Clostridia bacterium]